MQRRVRLSEPDWAMLRSLVPADTLAGTLAGTRPDTRPGTRPDTAAHPR